jgi:Flp pilus assembly protein TadG
MKMKRQAGQIMVLFAVGLVGLIGMAGLVIDGGRAYSDERSLVAAAEAAAHAGTFLMQKNWNGEAGNYGSLTDAQVRATAQAFAGYNGWNSSADTFFLDYIKPDRTTHVTSLDNTVRGTLVQLSKPQHASFTRVLGFQIFPVFARATAMFGAALVAGGLPLAIDDVCTPGYDINVGAQPANFGGSFGTCNFTSITPPGCPVSPDPNALTCYNNAMTNGMNPPAQLGPAYPVNDFDKSALSATTAALLQARIDARPGETCTTFKSPSPRVFFIPVVPGGFGGLTVNFVRYRAFFLTSITAPSGFTGCFVHATVNGGDFDPNAVGTAYGAVMIMKLIRSTGAITPVNITLTTITNPAVRGAVNGSTLTVRTNQPGANCTVLVYDLPPAAKPAPSTAGGLGPKITDGSGNATWTWTVEATALLGLAQVQVSCSYRGFLGYLFTSTVIA